MAAPDMPHPARAPIPPQNLASFQSPTFGAASFLASLLRTRRVVVVVVLVVGLIPMQGRTAVAAKRDVARRQYILQCSVVVVSCVVYLICMFGIIVLIGTIVLFFLKGIICYCKKIRYCGVYYNRYSKVYYKFFGCNYLCAYTFDDHTNKRDNSSNVFNVNNVLHFM